MRQLSGPMSDKRAHMEETQKIWAAFKATDRCMWPLECVYCGGHATTLDHIIPRVQGGDIFDPDNLVPACNRCNASKGPLTPDQWLAAGLFGRRGQGIPRNHA